MSRIVVLDRNAIAALLLALGMSSGCSPKSTVKDDPVCPIKHLDGPAIETFLPQLTSVRRISASLVQSRGPDVKVEVPESEWAALFALLIDSRPVELECEMSLLMTITTVSKIGESHIAYIYDNFPPIVYAVKTKTRILYFATDKPRDEVLEFFEAFAIK